MSATEELRRLLDERGVEYDTAATVVSGTVATFWHDRDGYPCSAIEGADDIPSGEVSVQACITPEQAIAATLGRVTCHNSSKVMDEHGQARFACSECGAWIDSRMLWNPEYRNGESPWVNDCKLNYCPNCGRKVVKE